MSAGDWPRVSIVWGYRGGEWNWAVEFGPGMLLPSERAGFDTIVDEAAAAAALLNTTADADNPIAEFIRKSRQ